MTTAARPTFDPARGGSSRGEKDLSALSKQYSSRDLPGHLKLKYRETGQGTTEELRHRDFRKELDEREREVRGKPATAAARKAIEASSATSNKKSNAEPAAALVNLDADDPVDKDSSDEESDSDDEDDTAALLAELQKIKQEREQEAMQEELKKKQEEERIRMENIFSGNPLLNYTQNPASSASTKTGDLKVKRRWDDDVVFKNCARSEPAKKGHFINDSLRSDFHKKFMEKYIK